MFKLGRKTRGVLCMITLAYFANVYFYKGKEKSLIVEIAHGKLQGIVETSRNGKEYFTYKGIPFAEPPVGPLRFEPPLPYSKTWHGVRDVSYFGAKCIQLDVNIGQVAGEEDCLFLNVFTPKFDLDGRKSPLPVMVFIHGGSFFTGSSDEFHPKYFMDEDIILVTMNYRLGALGFLNTGDEIVRGNMGLKDQTMGLKWVQKNIGAFGGDVNRVTIFGCSSGGSSVHFHMISQLSKGLFQRAISQSGTALAPWATFKKPKKQAERFGALLNCPMKNSNELVSCLKNINAEALVEIHKELQEPIRNAIAFFVPTVEAVNDQNTFLSDYPEKLLKIGAFSKVPWITGINSNEGLLFAAAIYRNDTMMERIRNNFHEIGGAFLDINPLTESALLSKIQDYYFLSKTSDPLQTAEEEFRNYSNLFSDRSFVVPFSNAVKLQASQSQSIYLYFYAYERDMSLPKYVLAAKGRFPIIIEVGYEILSSWIKQNIFGIEPTRLGVGHADELAMFFPVPYFYDINPGEKYFQFSVDMIKLWISFASHEKVLKFRGVPWLPMDLNSGPKYLKLDDYSSVIEDLFSQRVKFWNSIDVT